MDPDDANYNEIEHFAKAQYTEAKVAASTIQFSARARYSKNERAGELQASMIGYEPEFAVLDTCYGMGAWASILSVDLRKSSERAVQVGAKDTYLTMHTYLPTMAELVAKAGGKIVGLRGDGLFAAFGLTKLTGKSSEVGEAGSLAVQSATNCGKAMLEATDEIINGILVADGIEGGLAVGVGVAVGEIVVTRIGLTNANEVTAYGPPVNQACKLSGKIIGIRLTKGAHDVYPTAKGGRGEVRALRWWVFRQLPERHVHA